MAGPNDPRCHVFLGFFLNFIYFFGFCFFSIFLVSICGFLSIFLVSFCGFLSIFLVISCGTLSIYLVTLCCFFETFSVIL